MAISRKQIEEILAKEGESDQKVSELLNVFHKSEDDLKEQALKEKERADTLQKQIDEDEKLMAKLKRDEKSNESLQQSLNERDERIKSLEDELVKGRIKSSAQLRAISEGAINPDIVVSQLDLEAVTEKDGVLIGLEEQFKALKEGEDTAFLFKTETPQSEPPTPKNDYAPREGKSTEVSLGKQAAARYRQRHQTANYTQPDGEMNSPDY